MSTVGNERLLKVANFLDQLKESEFDFDSYVAEDDGKGCGTVCCAIGWLPKLFPDSWKWYLDSYWNILCPRLIDSNFIREFEATAVFFEITGNEANYLFDPNDSGLGRHAKPAQVANHIRKFVSSRCG